MRRAALLAFGIAACKHDSGPAPVESTSAASSTVAPPPAPSQAPSTVEYGGSYSAVAGTLFVPEGGLWDGFKFRGDDAGALGDGTLHLVITTDGGAVIGDLEGPLGPATLSGVAQGSSVSFHVAPAKAPDSPMFAGTGMGTVGDSGIAGEIHVSSWRGNVLRDATFQAQRR